MWEHYHALVSNLNIHRNDISQSFTKATRHRDLALFELYEGQ